MPFKTEWEGTDEELLEVVEESLFNISQKFDISLGREDLRKLFCDVFSRSDLQNEIGARMQMIYLTEEELCDGAGS